MLPLRNWRTTQQQLAGWKNLSNTMFTVMDGSSQAGFTSLLFHLKIVLKGRSESEIFD